MRLVHMIYTEKLKAKIGDCLNGFIPCGADTRYPINLVTGDESKVTCEYCRKKMRRK